MELRSRGFWLEFTIGLVLFSWLLTLWLRSMEQSDTFTIDYRGRGLYLKFHQWIPTLLVAVGLGCRLYSCKKSVSEAAETPDNPSPENP